MRRQRDTSGLRSVFLICVIPVPLRRSAKGWTGHNALAPQLEDLPVPTDEGAYDVIPTAFLRKGKGILILILTLTHHGKILLRRLHQRIEITRPVLRQVRQIQRRRRHGPHMALQLIQDRDGRLT